ncbi:hypothetical protein BXZ70DRAFT_957639 [Cristinia sonorae]|uniref:PH domain-containing protein n=1 Tax=Cristinia sonorae TaxID=1940300 RepID=A0A8K0UF24_9AGAR|nr:hypothetical protein BXZ70DRAFT_957639 [Cristinia sonorae]
MATFSDGVDTFAGDGMAGSSNGDMRLYLQTLLDGKERQLQQAGTLGQQLLAQRMELEERIRQLQELDLDIDDDADAGIRDKYRELADSIKQWDRENEHLTHTFITKPASNGIPSSSLPSQSLEPTRGELERSLERSKAAASGTTAAQSSRRAKNAAHRADDVEFAFEIGSGLLTEVRRLQSLLGERDKAIQDMKEEKDDLEKTVESLRSALRSQEQSADKYKEENWNLEVTLQELRTQLTEYQAASQRLESEQKRLTRLLAATRESVDQHKTDAERHQTAYEELKAKHETDIAQARKHAASLQRDKSDLQQTLDSMKMEMTKASKRLPRFGSPLTPNGASASEMLTPHEADEDDVFSIAASTNRKRMDNNTLFPADGPDFADSSPDPSPSRPFLAPNHPTNEIEALQQRLAHANRQINTLKGTLQREKELRMEYRRKLDSSPGYTGGDDDVEDYEDDDTAETKPKPRVTPYRAGRGGRGRGRGRGMVSSLIHKFGAAADSPSSEWTNDDEARESSPPPPLPAMPTSFDDNQEDDIATLEQDEEEEEEVTVEQSPSPALASNRASVASVTSVDGMDPIFANVLRRSGSTSSMTRSPLRRSLLGRPSRGRGTARRARGGAAYQQNRPPSFAGEPEALSEEFGFGSTMEDTLELPEVETAEFGCQTEQDETETPTVVLEAAPLPEPTPPPPPPPVLAEIGIQVEPEPAPVVVTAEVSLQTDEAALPVYSHFSVQHEYIAPSPLLISTSVETDPLPEPTPLVPAAISRSPSPAVSHVEVQTLVTASVDADTQTVPEVTLTPSKSILADMQAEDRSVFGQLDSLPAETSGDTTITPRPATLTMPYDEYEEDGTQTETGSLYETETETGMETDDYQDARQSISLATPTESMDDDFQSIMTVSDNDFSDSDEESIKASRISSRAALSATPSAVSLPLASTSAVPDAPLRTYEEIGVSAEAVEEPKIVEVIKVKEIIRTIPAPAPPKPVVKEMSIQTDQWMPPASPTPLPALLPAPFISSSTSSTPASPTTSLPYRVGPPSQQFQFISPPPSAGPTTTSLPIVAAPSPSHRDAPPTFLSRPRTSTSDRRQSIESTLSNAMDDIVARSRTPSGGALPIDKSRPPMMVLPPPPRQPPPPNSMPPPNFIPERRIPVLSNASEIPPPRPSSPPPPELIQRATTPTFGSVLQASGGRQFGLRVHGSSMPPSQQGLRQPPSTSSFRSAANAATRASPSAHSLNLRDREHREMSTTSFNSNGHSLGSQRSSISSDHHFEDAPSHSNLPVTPERQLPDRAGPVSTDPTVIHAITQTMIGEFLYKYTRRAIGKGHGERRHKRFFWVHPYTRTLYWSSADPGSTGVAESSAKSAYIEDVRAVMDPNPMPPGIHQYSVVVSTPQREMKFTAPTKERHDIWLSALQYLLSRPSAVVTSPANGGLPQSPVSADDPLPDVDHHTPQQQNVIASPQSQRSARTTRTGLSADSWNITPRGHRSQSQISLSHTASMGKRSGTPAAEYLRWANVHDGPQSPTKSFEHIPGQDDGELDFELHDEVMSDDGYEGLENVRACCDGRHTVGRSGRIEHHHHHHHHHNHGSQREPSRTREQHLDANPRDIARPVSPAWSFRSRAGSASSHDGTGFFSRFGTRRSTKSALAQDR